MSKIVQILLLGPVPPPASWVHGSLSLSPLSTPHQNELSFAHQQLASPTRGPFPLGIPTTGMTAGKRRRRTLLEETCEGDP